MFDLAWSEIALIAVVALIVIGPKDLPDAVRGVARMVKKARTMAGEMQGHMDEMVREANLHEVRETIQEIRNFNLRDEIEKHVDGDGSVRSAFQDPMRNSYSPPSPGVTPEAPAFIPPAPDSGGAPAVAMAPAFVPPSYVPPPPVVVAPAPLPPMPSVEPAVAASAPIPPAVLPPAAVPAPVAAKES